MVNILSIIPVAEYCGPRTPNNDSDRVMAPTTNGTRKKLCNFIVNVISEFILSRINFGYKIRTNVSLYLIINVNILLAWKIPTTAVDPRISDTTIESAIDNLDIDTLDIGIHADLYHFFITGN